MVGVPDAEYNCKGNVGSLPPCLSNVMLVWGSKTNPGSVLFGAINTLMPVSSFKMVNDLLYRLGFISLDLVVDKDACLVAMPIFVRCTPRGKSLFFPA